MAYTQGPNPLAVRKASSAKKQRSLSPKPVTSKVWVVSRKSRGVSATMQGKLGVSMPVAVSMPFHLFKG